MIAYTIGRNHAAQLQPCDAMGFRESALIRRRQSWRLEVRIRVLYSGVLSDGSCFIHNQQRISKIVSFVVGPAQHRVAPFSAEKGCGEVVNLVSHCVGRAVCSPMLL